MADLVKEQLRWSEWRADQELLLEELHEKLHARAAELERKEVALLEAASELEAEALALDAEEAQWLREKKVLLDRIAELEARLAAAAAARAAQGEAHSAQREARCCGGAASCCCAARHRSREDAPASPRFCVQVGAPDRTNVSVRYGDEAAPLGAGALSGAPGGAPERGAAAQLGSAEAVAGGAETLQPEARRRGAPRQKISDLIRRHVAPLDDKLLREKFKQFLK